MSQKTDFPWLNDLNPQQRLAVTHGDGPLLVIAGAGSGKTRTLASRVGYLIATGVDPSRILLLTFTRRAAEEMLKRAATVVQASSSAVSGRVWGGTFHAIANRLLRIYAKAAGLNRDFTIMDESDAEDLLNVIRHELGFSKKSERFPRKSACRAIYSRCVNGSEDLAVVLDRYFPWCARWETQLKLLFKKYVERKQQRSVLDYDDLLLYWEQILADDEMAKVLGGRFDHILVDEYQDTNIVQANILRGMRRFHPNLMVVGDDAQSIYSFRSATVRNILDFPQQFPGATVITLDQNYRSVIPVLEATNTVIKQAGERFTKNLWSARTGGQKPRLVSCKDESQQDKYVVDTILEHYEQGIPLRKQAVLFRASHHSDSLEIELSRRNIPYHKYGGLRFLEAAHVKDLLAFLRIVENPRDEMGWFRILQLLDGIGPTTAGHAMSHVWEKGSDPREIKSFAAPAAARENIAKLAVLMEDLVRLNNGNPAAQIERVRSFYDPLLEKHYDNTPVRRQDLKNLEQIASGYDSLGRFLSELTLDPPTSTGDLAGPPQKDEDWLVLSTIHSAKGCEWDVVVVIHAADGCLPSDMSTGSAEEIEEELRLTYVAMTRARDFLYVTWPMRYYFTWSRFTDKHSYAKRSRFLSEDVCALFDQVSLADPAGKVDEESVAVSRQDIASRLKSRWD